MVIIEYLSNRAKEIADLFYMAVRAIDSLIYSEEQKNTWAPSPIDYAAWRKRLDIKRPYLLLIDHKVAGFIELESYGHIDCAYVSRMCQRKGVATALLKHVTCIAKKLDLEYLYEEASIIAKPLFEKFGFLMQHENKVVRYNIVLVNFTMSK